MHKRPHHLLLRSRWLGWLAVILLAPLLAGCGQNTAQPVLRVVATIAPLGDWARQIGQARVDVAQIVPAGVDPKTYVLTDADRQALANADVVLSNGLGLEPWLVDGLRSRDPNTFVAMQLADFVGPLVDGQRITTQSPLAGEDAQGRPLLSTQAHTVYVPQTVYSSYIWLSFGPLTLRAQRAVVYIGDTFTRADPQGISFYRGNAERYAGELENLSTWIKHQVDQWPRPSGSLRPVIQVADRSWYYFAVDYGITLRTLNNGQPTATSIEQASTPLFGNRYLDASQQARLFRPVDAVLDPFVSDNYVDMIRKNVAVMGQAVQSAAARAATEGAVPVSRSMAP